MNALVYVDNFEAFCWNILLSANLLFLKSVMEVIATLQAHGDISTQAQARLFKKGPENWSFYVVKIRGSSRLGLNILRRAHARAWLFEKGPENWSFYVVGPSF